MAPAREGTGSRAAQSTTLLGDRGLFARLFEDRSGRIIAVTRFVLAAVFYIALWIDPSQPLRSSRAGYVILFFYLVLAVAMGWIAWRSWWWDRRLAWPAHVVDILTFLAAVYFTEGGGDDFTSPFLAFFAFLMLSATIRWDWRLTAITGFAATLLYLLVGLSMQWLSIDIDIFRFGRRVVYMAVLAIILIWLGRQRSGQHVRRFVESPGSAEDRVPPMLDALRYAMEQLGARRGAIAWAQNEEPQIELRTIGLAGPGGTLAPGLLPGNDGFVPQPQLFDRSKGRVLREGRAGTYIATGPVGDGLAELYETNQGLSLPFEAVTGRGAVLLADIPGASSDHVLKAAEISREIAAGFDRHSTLSLAQESAITLMRDTLARDLHDTIAQSLAGAALRLEALRTWIASGGAPDPEIQSIKAALKSEQAQVRSMISRLRAGEDMTPRTAAAQCLGPLLADLAVYWSVEAGLAPGSGRVAVPGGLIHDLRQLMREAVANAVRHGAASVVTVALEEGHDGLRVTITDNGKGFDGVSASKQPRTISERTAQAGGRLEIVSSHAGATLQLCFPRGEDR